MEEGESLTPESAVLITHTMYRVSFFEADPLGIMWHGHYIKLFEHGREDFGRQFGLSYMDIYRAGYAAPIIHIQCDYKKSLQYNDTCWIETVYIPQEAAKLRFDYSVLSDDKQTIMATGHSIQVFLKESDRQLQLIAPDFFLQWKSKWTPNS